MFRRSAKPLSGRYLSRAEREELAIYGGRRGSAGDRPADGAVSVDDLAGVATQMRDAQRGPGLSGNRQRSGMRTGPLGAQSLRSWRSTRRAERMCMID